MSWWFPRLNKRGDIISGDGVVWLNGDPLLANLDSRRVLLGHSPHWFTEDEIFVSAAEGVSRIVNVHTGNLVREIPEEFNGRISNISGISAGAGHWCGFRPDRGLVYDGGLVSAAAAPGAIDPQTGTLSYLSPYQANVRNVVVNSRVVQTAHCNDLTAGAGWTCWQQYVNGVPRLWGHMSGVVGDLSPMPQGEFSFVGQAARAPNGTLWVSHLTHKGVIVHPWGGHDGYIFDGEFFYHDFGWVPSHSYPGIPMVENKFLVVGTNSRGALRVQTVDITAPRTDLRSYRPSVGVPEPPPPPPENGDIVEINKNAVLAIRDELWNDPELKPRLMANKEETTSRSRRFLAKMVQVGHSRGLTRMGLLYKGSSKGITADIITWKKNGAVAVADVLSGGDGIGEGGAHNREPKKAWKVHGDMPGNWKHVVPGDPEFPQVGGTPVPPQTHKYIGGGNDTGTCDECERSRFDPIHNIPQASQPHIYDGGEQDTGLCDICQKPPTDVLHGTVEPPPPPPPSNDIAELKRQIAELRGHVDSQIAQLSQRIDALASQPPGSGGVPSELVTTVANLEQDVERIKTALSKERVTYGASGGLFGGSHQHKIDPIL